MGQKPQITVVIVNWNGREMLRACLQALRTSQVPQCARILVVDNASKDGSLDMVKQSFPEMEAVNSGANLGFARGCNLARASANTDFVFFLNPDTEVIGDAVQRMAQFLASDRSYGAVSCKLLCPDHTVQDQMLQRDWPDSPVRPSLWYYLLRTAVGPGLAGRLGGGRGLPLASEESGDAFKLYGGCLMVRREALEQAGWFDERYFMYAEDVDLCYTIRRHGWKLYYLGNVQIMHVGGGLSGKAASGFSVLMQAQSMAQFAEKYHGLPGALLFRLSTMAGALCKGLLFLPAYPASFLSKRFDRRHAAGRLLAQRLLLLWGLGLKRAVVSH